MRKAKVTVPAVSTNLGPGVESLALALALPITATFSERRDTRLVVETRGEGSVELTADCYHPVMYAATRVFQRLEDAPLGLHLLIHNHIPLRVGLGAEDAMTVAGLAGANALMDTPLSRDELIQMGAAVAGRAGGVVAAMLGGLTVASGEAEGLLYRRVDVVPLRVVVVAPEVDAADEADAHPESVPLSDAIHNLGRLTLVVDALRSGDFRLLERALDDRLLEPHLKARIPGFDEAKAAAREAGAVAVTISDYGPALLAFALFNHRKIAASVEAVFQDQGIAARSWTLPVDTQGVVISAGETIP